MKITIRYLILPKKVASQQKRLDGNQSHSSTHKIFIFFIASDSSDSEEDKETFRLF